LLEIVDFCSKMLCLSLYGLIFCSKLCILSFYGFNFWKNDTFAYLWIEF
jgi:hypothetical protein